MFDVKLEEPRPHDMADESIREWAEGLLRTEQRRFERARTRFIRKPSADHLHDVRTAARRLRSLLEDISDVIDIEPIRTAIKPLITSTGTARDAAVIREVLRDSLSDDERAIVRPLLRELRLTERNGRRKARKRARSVTSA